MRGIHGFKVNVDSLFVSLDASFVSFVSKWMLPWWYNLNIIYSHWCTELQ
jgi:hypothetical protein